MKGILSQSIISRLNTENQFELRTNLHDQVYNGIYYDVIDKKIYPKILILRNQLDFEVHFQLKNEFNKTNNN